MRRKLIRDAEFEVESIEDFVNRGGRIQMIDRPTMLSELARKEEKIKRMIEKKKAPRFDLLRKKEGDE